MLLFVTFPWTSERQIVLSPLPSKVTPKALVAPFRLESRPLPLTLSHHPIHGILVPLYFVTFWTTGLGSCPRLHPTPIEPVTNTSGDWLGLAGHASPHFSILPKPAVFFFFFFFGFLFRVIVLEIIADNIFPRGSFVGLRSAFIFQEMPPVSSIIHTPLSFHPSHVIHIISYPLSGSVTSALWCLLEWHSFSVLSEQI